MGLGADKCGVWLLLSLLALAAPSFSRDIRPIYRSDAQIRIEWDPYPDPRLQHYEVMILERSREGEGVQVFRDQVPAGTNSYVFNALRPATDYVIGVIANVDNDPRQVYKLETETARIGARAWSASPTVSSAGVGQFSVRWAVDQRQFGNQNLQGFLIEYRLPNETSWRRYGDVVPYRPGQDDYSQILSGLSDKIFYAVR